MQSLYHVCQLTLPAAGSNQLGIPHNSYTAKLVTVRQLFTTIRQQIYDLKLPTTNTTIFF
jgi:hypothetical protein